MSLILYDDKFLNAFYRQRVGETRLGDTVNKANGSWPNLLENPQIKFVLVGIPEDIGVRANFGRPGAVSAFKPVLESLLTTQDNDFLKGHSLLIAGEVSCADLQNKAESLDPKQPEQLVQLRQLVETLDTRVSTVVETIIAFQKIPILIGGGHNNAFGNIVGASRALKHPMHVLNCDPHLDFRAEEGRHSGNGFSYAYSRRALEKYAVVGMHESYNNNQSIQKFKSDPIHLFYNSYEDIFVRNHLTFELAVKQAIGFLGYYPCGIELDMDAITNVPSSARTSSGISPIQARQYVHLAATHLPAYYLHIAEAAPILAHRKADNKTGKLIAYLITDFMKAVLAKS